MKPPNFHFTSKNQPCSQCDYFRQGNPECKKHRYDLNVYFQNHIPNQLWDNYIQKQYFPFTCGDFDDTKFQKVLKEKQKALKEKQALLEHLKQKEKYMYILGIGALFFVIIGAILIDFGISMLFLVLAGLMWFICGIISLSESNSSGTYTIEFPIDEE